MTPPYRLDLGCNSACRCGASPGARVLPAPYLQQMQKDINAAKTAGARELLITGGEATAHPQFLAMVSYTKSLGFKKIHLQTDARLFRSADKAREAVREGVTHCEVFLHGSRPDLQTLAGMKNMAAAGATISVGVALAEPNDRELAGIVRIAAKFEAKCVRFYTARPPEAQGHIDQACALARRAGLTAEVAGMSGLHGAAG